jgi:hypothetical protein
VNCLWQLDASSSAELLVADPDTLLHAAQES